MTELEALRQRHSVRAYQDKKIEADKVSQINALIEECNKEGNLNLQLLEDAGGTFGRVMSKVMGLGSAPSVIACIGPDDSTLDERIGYYGQKIVLFAQSIGLNTCWAGTFSEKKSPAKRSAGDRFPIVIAIGYGVNGGRVRKSKSLDQVVAGGIEGKPEWFVKGAEAALFAPTAINQQRFEIVLKDGDTVEIVDKGGVLSKIDKGIVKYNFEVGSRQ
ncbi:MAG: nitroreductase [Clostridia bacterium]|nr:nitroreductase [Clostridia bacterium]